MGNLPQRVSLVEQVAASLRRELLSGRWADQMPGEHALSDELKVSRSTLRIALHLLRREGLFQVSRGRRRRPKKGVRAHRPAPSAIVAIISSQPLHEHRAGGIIIVDEVRRHLQQAGLTLQWHVLPQSTRHKQGERLGQFVEQTRAACWILSSCSLDLQKWFQDRGVPTVVQGSCHEGITLPFIRFDAAAACRHAIGLLHARGHRRITLLLPRAPYAGAVEIENSFHRACARLPELRTHSFSRYHEATSAGIERTLASVMQAKLRPTALIVMMPDDTLSVQNYLLRQGFRLPRDISLVSLFDDHFLARITPTISRYTSDSYKLARRLARVVVKLTGRAGNRVAISIFPDFIPGATIGPPPTDVISAG